MNNILLCQSAQLESGDVIAHHRGSRQVMFYAHRMMSNKRQDYFSHRLVGGRKYEAFLDNRECAEWSNEYRANLWNGYIDKTSQGDAIMTYIPSITVRCRQLKDGQMEVKYIKMSGCTELTRTIAIDALRIAFGGGGGTVTQTMPYTITNPIRYAIEGSDHGN